MLGVLIGCAIASHIAECVTTAAVAASDNSNKNKSSKSHHKERKPDEVVVNITAEDLRTKDFRDAIRILIGAGFTNIHLTEIRDSYEHWYNKGSYGHIQEVSINGRNDFGKNAVFFKDAYAEIKATFFIDSPPVVVPELEELQRKKELLFQEQLKAVAPVANATIILQEREVQEEQEEHIFCEYCDCILEKGKTSCTRCGASITRMTLENKSSSKKQYCVNCGKQLNMNDVFCYECGYKVGVWKE